MFQDLEPRAVVTRYPDQLVLNSDGTVRQHSNWVDMYDPWTTHIKISRLPGDTFEAYIRPADELDPARTVQGTFDHVMQGLHPTDVQKYRSLFALVNPTAKDLTAIGFNANVSIVTGTPLETKS